ncbi:MAG: SGNH/GDSL hydrolase family protein [Planctomycetaceae bacterium]
MKLRIPKPVRTTGTLGPVYTLWAAASINKCSEFAVPFPVEFSFRPHRMNPLVAHIVSGHSFFTGISLLVCGVLLSSREARIWKRLAFLACVVGVLGIALSSTAIPYWLYAIAITITTGWLVSLPKKKWRRRMTIATVSVWIVAAAIELPFHTVPQLEPIESRGVTIIGDSVTAGVGGDETSETWPAILQREHGLAVQDISHVGETAASALKRATAVKIESPLVIVEIGGNDVLGSTSAARFERDLDALLSHLQAPNRQIVMFELPLPPFFHEYGRVQRKVAANHNVALIPKRVFLTVLAGGDSTLDTIHLSQAGHQAMANAVWDVVGEAITSQ